MPLSPADLRKRGRPEGGTALTATQISVLADRLEASESMAQEVMDALVASGKVVVWRDEWLRE